MAILVDLEKVSVRTADRTLFHELSLTISDGDRIGIVGINGTGKSTLLRVIAGAEDPEEGSVRRGRSVRVGYLEQDPVLAPGLVSSGLVEDWQSEAMLERLGMGAQLSTDVSQLSGGQTKRVALARVLTRKSDLLVLDEPTNHLDLAAVSWLERQLLQFRGGLVLVSHDRHLLDRVTNRMVELDRGHRYVHEGGYSSYLAARSERDDQAAQTDAVRRNLARRELAWLRRGAPARTRKPQARIDAAKRVLAERSEAPARAFELALRIGTPRLGDKVIECAQIGYRYHADGAPILSGIDLDLAPRERLGIVGANGSGKSTLLDLLAGQKVPSKGQIDIGTTVVIGYYSQLGVELDPQARLQDLVAGPTRAPGSLEDIALMERFWFTGDLPFAPVGTLSGGERRRLQLLLVLARRPNVLLLDEPTNDLDLDTLRVLEDFFDDWPGALVVVSHDRTFLERTTDQIAELDAGRLNPVSGGLSVWLANIERTSERRRVLPQNSGQVRVRPASQGRGRSKSTIYRETREVEKEIAQLERRRESLSSALVGTVEHDELARLGSDLAEVQTTLDAAENRWLNLSEESEQRQRRK